MKIYTRVVMDMATGETLHEESYEHDGPVALCDGGGGADMVDEEYNRRMATLYEKTYDIGEEYHNLYKYGQVEPPKEEVQYEIGGKWMSPDQARQALAGTSEGPTLDDLETMTSFEKVKRGTELVRRDVKLYNVDGQWMKEDEAQAALDTGAGVEDIDLSQYPSRTVTTDQGNVSQMELEQRQIEANYELVPEQTGLAKEQIGAKRELLPKQTGLAKEQIGAKRELLPKQTEYEKLRLKTATENLEKAQPIFSEYIDQTIEGMDPQKQMGLATTDVASAYKDAGGTFRRRAGRLGLDPSSGAYAAQMKDIGLNQARDVAGARTKARRQTELENYKRLKGATNLAVGLGGK